MKMKKKQSSAYFFLRVNQILVHSNKKTCSFLEQTKKLSDLFI